MAEGKSGLETLKEGGSEMRVLLAVEKFSPRFGGAESYAVDLARGLARAGVSVEVAAHEFESVPPGVGVIPIRPLPWP
ncbi:MAG: hypothetical protein ACYTFG_03915, partial [Planctomycetota bacterium]